VHRQSEQFAALRESSEFSAIKSFDQMHQWLQKPASDHQAKARSVQKGASSGVSSRPLVDPGKAVEHYSKNVSGHTVTQEWRSVLCQGLPQ